MINIPNHVINSINIKGSDEDVLNLLLMIQHDDIGIGSFDFNKIIPMPSSLNIEAGSRTDRGSKHYKAFISEMLFEKGVSKIDDLNLTDLDESLYLRRHPDIRRDEWELGKQACMNRYLYNAETWYEWSLGNWGTKWNSYGYPEKIDFNIGDPIRFQTAWSAPHPVLEELARSYSHLEFEHQWADEDLGANCGRKVYKSGQLVETYYPEANIESMDFACELWEYSTEELGYYKNQAGTEYIYPEDTSCELATLDGKDVLFTQERLTDEDVPEGLHTYHLRENLSRDPQSYIEKVAADDFAATIITRDMLDFNGQKSIALIPSEHIEFSGKEIDLLSFLNNDLSNLHEISSSNETGLTAT